MTSGPLHLFQVTTICELITNDNLPTTINQSQNVCLSFSYYYPSLTFVLEPNCAVNDINHCVSVDISGGTNCIQIKNERERSEQLQEQLEQEQCELEWEWEQHERERRDS